MACASLLSDGLRHLALHQLHHGVEIHDFLQLVFGYLDLVSPFHVRHGNRGDLLQNFLQRLVRLPGLGFDWEQMTPTAWVGT